MMRGITPSDADKQTIDLSASAVERIMGQQPG